MSAPDTSTALGAVEKPTQPEPLRAVVEAYVPNHLDTTTHPSHDSIQQEAREPGGRSIPVISVERPTPFVSSGTLCDVTDDDPEDDEPSLEDFYRDVGEESLRLTQAMEEYEKVISVDGKRKKRDSVLSKNLHTWEEVLKEVEGASDRYNEPDGIWGKIRKAFRKSADKADIASAWLALLPNQSEYFSILCGGLKLIIGAASRLNRVRDDIAKALIEIPHILSCTHRAQNIFNKSKELRQASAYLFVAIISVLQHILVYFKEKSLIQQSDYEQRLTEAIDTLGTRSSQFDRVARTCGLEEIHYIRSEMHEVRVDMDRIKTEVHQHINLAREESYAQSQKMEYRLQSYMAQAIQSLGHSLASGNVTAQDLQLPLSPIKKSRSARELRKHRNNLQQALLDKLDYDAAMTESDLQNSTPNVWRLPKPAQDRILAIVRHHKFKSWLTDTGSSVFFLNGHYIAHGSMRQCPTSFVCAKLAAMPWKIEAEKEPSSRHPPLRTITISFFCAQHLHRDDEYKGPRGIMKSLIAQLLVSYDFDTQVIGALDEEDFEYTESLCDAFKLLVDSLSAEIVLMCTIDAITEYEESERYKRRVGDVVKALAKLAYEDEERKCTFKLFLTCPRVSRKYGGKVGNGTVVTMPERVESQGNFTTQKWDYYLGTGTP
ncbi:conserved hypothetical protein [Pyrenophora tritici-repentis Pt-1C-BFP]|uniref:Uncharacterized protein n=1 Tax=Pyrenophora tritici-repentis (strain Pt-1C-BFP) TaxID=426418 RepID=B2WH66_PYRTR|nr:uncharacterized protein PTRG_09325 [Pyrenophora tritici-repentis Pt-1C-BFP]EDU42376.1 conserved hypothetical protein [Pyrenophora tritici-repentis Pt-1C-BFP]